MRTLGIGFVSLLLAVALTSQAFASSSAPQSAGHKIGKPSRVTAQHFAMHRRSNRLADVLARQGLNNEEDAIPTGDPSAAAILVLGVMPLLRLRKRPVAVESKEITWSLKPE